MWGLMDCNNFFVSCERSVNPSLCGKPVVVLSGNDGCIVARSNEAKALGVPMGMPTFKLKDNPQWRQVICISSRHQFYVQTSNRVMAALRACIGDIVRYSIDESFFKIEGDEATLHRIGKIIAKDVYEQTAIPVSIGIAHSKTLAKVASKRAKKEPNLEGCCVIMSDEDRRESLANVPLGDVWGVGRRYLARLQANGAGTALDLANMNEDLLLKFYGEPLMRTALELRGKDLISIDTTSARKSISLSRSFPQMLGSEDEIGAWIANFASGCAKQLRDQHSACFTIKAYVVSNRFRDDLPQYFKMSERRFEIPCSNTNELVSAAMDILHEVYRPGILYKKAGVELSDLTDGRFIQTSIFDDNADRRRKLDKLTNLMDKINSISGVGTVKLAVQTTPDSNDISSALTEEEINSMDKNEGSPLSRILFNGASK